MMSWLNKHAYATWSKHALRYGPWIAAATAILFVAIIRWRLRDTPLERDEGEYAYMGQLMLGGVPAYQSAYTMKLPGISAAYAALMAVFGQTATGIHLGLLVVNAGTIVFVFLLGRKMFGGIAGAASAVAYALLSTSPSALGLAAHATHFVVLFTLAGMWVLLRTMDVEGDRNASHAMVLISVGVGPRLFASGLLFGLALMMKQHGVAFGLLGLGCLLWHDWPARKVALRQVALRALIYCGGVGTPLLIAAVVLFCAGVFPQFIFWTVTEALNYAGAVSLADGLEMLFLTLTGLVVPNLILWILAVAGFALLLIRPETPFTRLFLAGFLVAAVAAITPGLYFRPHYFIMLLPAVAWMVGAFVALGGRFLCGHRTWVVRFAPLLIFGLATAATLYQNRGAWFQLTPYAVCRQMFGAEPFPESLPIAAYLKEHTKKTDRIAVLGSEPQIFFYAHRQSATGYIYMFPLMEPTPGAARMQAAMINEIEEARPQYIVYVRSYLIWLRRPDSPTTIFSWAEDYLSRNYFRVGVIDQIAPERTEYRWDADSVQYRPESEFYTEVYQRKPPLPR